MSLKTDLSIWLTLLLVATCAHAQDELARSLNGFELEKALVPAKEILSGGVGRDGIPSIDNPRFVRPARAKYLKDDDIVISFTHAGKTRAYPLRILDRHELVNDEIAGKPILVSYCPLCATGMVFSRSIGDEVLEFGVSGLLHHSDVLMYDRATDSLWSQLGMRAISGQYAGRELEWLPAEEMTFAAWKKIHPNGRVLSDKTGFSRDYLSQAYIAYRRSPKNMFPVPQKRTDLEPKEMVAGIVFDGQAKAYPLELLEKKGRLNDEVNGIALEIEYDPAARHIRVVKKASGQRIPSVNAYWFAWQAFHPDTELYGD